MANGGRDPEELLSRARTGDGETLGRLLEVYRNYLRMLAELQIGRRLQAKVDASDVVQDTFLEAHRHFGGFRGTSEAELLVWLRNILATQLRTLFRRYQTAGRDLYAEIPFEADLDRSSLSARGLASSQSTPSQDALRRERAVILADALSRLPPHYREVLMMHHLEGISLQDVAWRMKRSLDSVKKLWVRALVALHDELGIYGNDLL